MSKGDGKKAVTLAHGAFIEGKYHAPESSVRVSADDAQSLTAAGYVVTDEAVGVVDTGASPSA